MAKSTKFEVTETFAQALKDVQNNIVHAWLAANPNARLDPITTEVAEGGLPSYLKKGIGKRADINRMMVKGMTVAKFLPAAKPLGGGYPDMVAGLLGGYSPSSKTWGRPAFTLTA
jgi:hypothetical protein